MSEGCTIYAKQNFPTDIYLYWSKNSPIIRTTFQTIHLPLWTSKMYSRIWPLHTRTIHCIIQRPVLIYSMHSWWSAQHERPPGGAGRGGGRHRGWVDHLPFVHLRGHGHQRTSPIQMLCSSTGSGDYVSTPCLWRIGNPCIRWSLGANKWQDIFESLQNIPVQMIIQCCSKWVLHKTIVWQVHISGKQYRQT